MPAGVYLSCDLVLSLIMTLQTSAIGRNPGEPIGLDHGIFRRRCITIANSWTNPTKFISVKTEILDSPYFSFTPALLMSKNDVELADILIYLFNMIISYWTTMMTCSVAIKAP